MRDDWLRERKRGIGGSDAAAICGLSPWKSPYQVWTEKRGENAGLQEDSEPMFWGRTLEPVIRQRYSDVTGNTVVVPTDIIRHPEIDFMLASLDGIANNERVLEVKTARMPMEWGEPGTNEIPDIYMLQVQHYLAVTKLSLADVAVLIGGSDFRIYEVPEDLELQGLLIEKETAFWKMVQDGTPPDVTTFNDIKKRFGAASKAIQVQATPDIISAVIRLKELKKMAKEEEELKARIMAHMADGDTLIDLDKILCTWKVGKGSRRFDAKSFQADNPELYEKYLNESEPVRRFLIK